MNTLKFFAVAAVALISIDVSASALYWRVDGDLDKVVSTVAGTDKLEINAARVAYRNDNGTSSGYLNLYWQADEAFTGDFDGEYDSQTAKVTMASGGTDPLWADFGDLSQNLTGYQFAIELGNYNKEGAGSWTKIADSGYNYEYYYSSHISHSDMFGDGMLAYVPSAYAAPEPTSGLLFLTGLSLMALRRRKVV